jgi:phosphopantetheinyl transferase
MSDADPLTAEKPYRFTPEQYYRNEVTYHGPAFQTVTKIERCAEDGMDALLRMPSKSMFFRASSKPQFLADPALLDTCGQSVGFWAADRLETGFATFPLGFERLEICGPWPQESVHVKCHVRIMLVTEARVRSNLEFVDSGGRLLIRVAGWEDSRFDFPRPFSRFVLSPCDRQLSESWTQPIVHLPSANLQCCFLEDLPAVIFQGDLWRQAFARLILNPEEREAWLNLKGTEKRRQEWMMGRVAVKDAVRALLRKKYKLELSPAEVEITTDKFGRPNIAQGLRDKLDGPLFVSIAHARGRAMAVAGESDGHRGIGVDMEYLERNRDGLATGSLSSAESTLLASVTDALQDEWLLRFWCAKEAIAKALGRGLAGGPLNLAIQEIEIETGKVGMLLAGELAEQFPDLKGELLTAYTYRNDDLILAASLV